MTDPEVVGLAGDWHGNSGWAAHAIRRLAAKLEGQETKLILHAGDFGLWPGRDGEEYLHAVEDSLAETGAELWFVDGNHEWHPRLHELRATRDMLKLDGPVGVGKGIKWLPRGYRWTWNGKTWLALGGATSVDRALRVEGESWWPEEAITDHDAYEAAAPGPADVMLCHDAPTRVCLDFGPWPRGWNIADKARADRHREVLQDITDKVRPELLIFGHYHRVVRQTMGRTRVLGLDMDGSAGNFILLDTRSLKEI